MDCLAWMMGGQLLGMMSCAGYGGEVANSDFYGKRSKLCLDFYGKRSKFERSNIKKHRGRARCFFCGDGVPLRGGVLAFQDFEGGAGGGAEHVDAGCQAFKCFCGFDAGAQRDAID